MLDETRPVPGFELELADGTRARLRPLVRADRDRLEKGLAELSRETLYRRFFQPVTELPDRELDRLADVDQHDHIAWGALDIDNPGFPGIGVARCARTESDPGVGETAITVVDRYQGVGAGTALLATLSVVANEKGIRTLRSYTLTENTRFIDFLRHLGAYPVPEGDGTERLDLPAWRADDRLPSNRCAEIFRKRLMEIEDKLLPQ